MKSKKLKISIIALLIIILNLLIFSIINIAAIDFPNMEPNDIANFIENNPNDWYNFSAKDAIGKDVKAFNADYKLEHLYCIAHNQSNPPNSIGWQILNIIDINNNTPQGKVKIYSVSNNTGKEYPVTDSKITPILELAHFAKLATQNNETDVSVGDKQGIAKYAMANIIYQKFEDTTLKDLGIDERLYNIFKSDGLRDEMENDWSNALTEATTVANAKFEKNMNQQESDAVTITTNNGKTFIGPYKMTISNCKVENIKITDNGTDKTANGISYDKSTTLTFDNLTSGRNFYIVVNRISE